MNASGGPNTCKSRGNIKSLFLILILMATGGRVSNMYVTYLLQENSLRKLGLMFYNIKISYDIFIKAEMWQKMGVHPIS